MSGTYSVNLPLKDWKVHVRERTQSLTTGDECGPLKTGDAFSLVSWPELSESLDPKLRRTTKCYYNSFRSTPREQLSDDISLSRNSTPCEESSGTVVASLKSYPKQGSQFNKFDDALEVICKGTKLMKTINFPTVIVKHLAGTLDKSKVYYINLEVTTENFTWELPAIMFSSPYARKKTRFAELLPFGLMKISKSFCLTPILQRKHFRRLFHSGFTFKIKSLIPGRAFDVCRENCWNRYDLRETNMQSLPTEIIEFDIKQMSLHIFKTIWPLKHRAKHSKGLRRSNTSEQRKLRSLGRVNLEEMEIPSDTADLKHTPFCKKIEPPRLGSNGGSTIWDFSIKLPPKINTNKNDQPDTFQKDSLTCLDELDKYCCISVIT